jgi:hypothetical protein
MWVHIQRLLLLFCMIDQNLIWAAGSGSTWKKLIVIDMTDDYFASIGGFPPENRNAYLPLLNKIKIYNPEIIYLDMIFSRKSKISEENFARQLNKGKRVIIPLRLDSDYQGENQKISPDLFSRKIKGYPAKFNPFPLDFLETRLELPEEEIIRQSESVANIFYPIFPDQNFTYMGFYQYHSGFLYENANIVILNSYLRKFGLQLKISGNYKSLILINNKTGTILSTLLRRNRLKEPFVMPNTFEYNETIPALSILSEKKKLAAGSVVLIGSSSIHANKLKTPVGDMASILVTANEINTLWKSIAHLIQEY